MDPRKSTDSCIQDCLKSLGIDSLAEWDVLVFVYRHRANLASADQISRLLGYPSKAVGASLDRLEAKSLIQRSRYSQGVRFYEFAHFGAPGAAESCLGQLMSLAENRAGRLVLIKALPQNAGLHDSAKGRTK